jgi:hypothetical protein
MATLDDYALKCMSKDDADNTIKFLHEAALLYAVGPSIQLATVVRDVPCFPCMFADISGNN